MVMQAGLGLRRDEIVGYIKSVLPIVIQQTKVGGWRGTSTVYFSRMAEWRQDRVKGKGRHGARRRL
jgi:type IV secretion system protein VirB11